MIIKQHDQDNKEAEVYFVLWFQRSRVYSGKIVWNQTADRETGAEAERSHFDLQTTFSESRDDKKILYSQNLSSGT